MSLQDLMRGHATFVFLNLDHFGEEVSLIHRGETSTVSAVVTIEPPQVSQDKGVSRVFIPKMQILDSVSVDLTSEWLIRGARYQTEKIAPPDTGGLREIELKKNSGNIRTAKS